MSRRRTFPLTIGYHNYTIMALLFTGRYFHEFHEKSENIIVNSCMSIALLHLKQSAS